MALQLDPWFPAALKSKGVTIVNADGTTKKTLYTAGINGGKVTFINWATDDTATADGQLWINDTVIDCLLGTKTIPISAGFITGTPAFSFFDGIQIPGVAIDRDGQRHLLVPPSGVIKVSTKVAVTAAKTHYVWAQAIDF